MTHLDDALTRLAAAINAGDDSAAEAAAVKLAAHGAAALAGLQPLLASPDPDRRWWALRVLGESGADEAGGLLAAGLTDPDPAARQCAALALRSWAVQAAPAGREAAAGAAVAPLASWLGSPDKLLSRLAGDALAALGPPVVPGLLQVMETGRHAARLEAARALALIADPRAIPALFAVFEQPSPLLEYWANEGLERMGVGMRFFDPY